MTIIKTSDLTGAALDWALAVIEVNLNNSAQHIEHFLSLRSEDVRYDDNMKQHRTGRFRYSERWDQSGPIIEREKIWLAGPHKDREDWYADAKDDTRRYGPTPLIAAMRCYAASKLGAEVDVPSELIGA